MSAAAATSRYRLASVIANPHHTRQQRNAIGGSFRTGIYHVCTSISVGDRVPPPSKGYYAPAALGEQSVRVIDFWAFTGASCYSWCYVCTRFQVLYQGTRYMLLRGFRSPFLDYTSLLSLLLSCDCCGCLQGSGRHRLLLLTVFGYSIREHIFVFFHRGYINMSPPDKTPPPRKKPQFLNGHKTKNVLRYNTPATSHRACPPWETPPSSSRFSRSFRVCCLAAVAALLLRVLRVSATSLLCLLDIDFCSSLAACSSPYSNLPSYQLLLWPSLCPTCSRTSLQSGSSMTGETASSITHSHGSLNVFVWGLCCILLPCEDNRTRFNNLTAQAASSYSAGISQLFRAARMATAAGTLCSTGMADSWGRCVHHYCSYIAHITTLILGPVSVHVS